MTLRKTITADIYPGEQRGYIAECLEVAVVTQGATLDELVSNLQEAVALYFEDEDTVALGLRGMQLTGLFRGVGILSAQFEQARCLLHKKSMRLKIKMHIALRLASRTNL